MGVRLAIKVLAAQHLLRLFNGRAVAQQHGAQDGLLCLDVLRWNTVEKGPVIGRRAAIVPAPKVPAPAAAAPGDVAPAV
jgi:hypothetical protein